MARPRVARFRPPSGRMGTPAMAKRPEPWYQYGTFSLCEVPMPPSIQWNMQIRTDAGPFAPGRRRRSGGAS